MTRKRPVSMQRRHFELIADALGDILRTPGNGNSPQAIVERMADKLATTNPQFDRERFVAQAMGDAS